LIVTGTARDISLRRLVLGSTVEELIRKARVPILIVRERVHGDYPAILAASDFSHAAAESFETAVGYFPGVPVTLFHGYQIPFSGILINDQIRAEFQELGDKAAREFLHRLGLPDGFPRIVRHGHPDQLLADYLVESGPALVVLGTHGASGFLGAAVGSMAQRILSRVQSDVLVVPFSKRN
jgi:nucleotide-binding universal stress UspA family protein